MRSTACCSSRRRRRRTRFSYQILSSQRRFLFAASRSFMTLEAILAAIPHRPPFLFLDEIVEQSADRIVCRRNFTTKEFFYQGHYPSFPLTPGVILCEAALQAGAVLLSQQAADAGGV